MCKNITTLAVLIGIFFAFPCALDAGQGRSLFDKNLNRPEPPKNINSPSAKKSSPSVDANNPYSQSRNPHYYYDQSSRNDPRTRNAPR